MWGWRTFLDQTSAATDFVLALAFWCGAAALVAWRLAAGSAALAAAAALALAMNPHALVLLLWPHTVAPMMVVAAGGAALIYLGARRPIVLAAAVAAAAAASMLSMQLFGFLFIGAGLLVGLARDLRDDVPPATILSRGALTLAAGAAGAACGLLAAFTLNWIAFGEFGFAIADWRRGDEAAGGGRAIALAAGNLADIARVTAENTGWAPFALAAAALAALAVRLRADPWRAAAIVVATAGVGASVAVLPLATGVLVPSGRGGVVLWLAVVAAVAFAGIVFRRPNLAAAALLVVAICGGSTAPAALHRASLDSRHDHALLDRLESAISAARDGSERRLVAVGRGAPFRLHSNILNGAGERGTWWFRLLLMSRFDGVFADGVAACPTRKHCPSLAPTIFEPAPHEGDSPPLAWRVGDAVVVDLDRASTER